jgi:CSLREA domain-containing protein
LLLFLGGGVTSSPADASLPGTNGRIAFAGFNLNGPGEIYVMNSDGSGRVNLTNDDSYDLSPRWSPDGTKIAFVSDRSGNMEVYVMNANGSGVVNLSQNPADDRSPAWSPDGTKIAFQTSRDGNDEIYVMNSNGSNQTNLTNFIAHDTDPDWSPDGTQIAFSFGNFGQRDIAVMDSAGVDSINITNTNGVDDFDPSWSPNGGAIAYTRHNGGTDYEIYAMSANGQNQTNTTNYPTADMSPAWSPDGEKIAFSSDDEGDRDVNVMNVDGSDVENLTFDYDPINASPDWEAIPCPSARLAAGLGGSCSLPGIVVNSKADTPDASAVDNKCFTGQQIGGKDECTLRAAIKHANDKPGADEITFSLPSGGLPLIPVQSDLPTITAPVTIDGGGPLDRVIIGRAGQNRAGTGLEIDTTNSTIRELGVTHFTTGIAILSGPGNTVLGSEFFDNFDGIALEADGNTIGGGAEGTFDLNYFRNNEVGLRIYSANNNQVPRNSFGYDEGNPSPNGIGIAIENANDNLIGDPATNGNAIAYSTKAGILIHDGSHGNTIQGNGITDGGGIGIGINTEVARPLPAYGNIIGGTEGDEENHIFRNAGDGIRIGISGSTDPGNLIAANGIYGNGGLGINLGEDGVTPNDPGDADDGGNHLQNYPELTAAWNDGLDLKVTGTLKSTPDQTFQIDVYQGEIDSTCDPSAYGEGGPFKTSSTVTTDGTGKAAFQIVDPFGHMPDGGFVTATASRFMVPGNPDTVSATSEFSRCVSVQPSTKLAEPAAPLNPTIKIDFDIDFSDAVEELRKIKINPGGLNEETKTIGPPGSPFAPGGLVLGADQTIALTEPLEFDHAAGEVVVLVQWEGLQGDVDCSGTVNAVDALKVLRHNAGLSVAQTPPCPPVPSSPLLGDINCNDAINAIDALLLLRYGAALPLSLPVACHPPGSIRIGGY